MEQPTWKRTYDAAEKRAAPTLENWMSNPKVIEAITIGNAVQRRARQDIAKMIRRQLHAVNLPSGTDVNAVSKQIAGLERQIRLLNRRIDELQESNASLEAALADKNEQHEGPTDG